MSDIIVSGLNDIIGVMPLALCVAILFLFLGKVVK